MERDKRLAKTGDSIFNFARDIASMIFVLVVISHKLLLSVSCMVHELLQAFRRRSFAAEQFGSDALALVLEDALDDFKDPLELVIRPGGWIYPPGGCQYGRFPCAPGVLTVGELGMASFAPAM